MRSAALSISRAVVAFVGAVALLLAAGNLLTGGGSLGDPVFPAGLAFGALTVGAAAWTSDPRRWRAVVVWLGIVAIGAAMALFIANFGDAAFADIALYFGIPAAIVALAAIGLAVARVRAGPIGE